MYKWAKKADYLKSRKFDGAELDARPEEETKGKIWGQPMHHSSEMLPPVSDVLHSLRAQLTMPGAREKELKTDLT